MPSNLLALIALCRRIRAASDEELRALDQTSVAVATEALVALRGEVDAVLRRLLRLNDPPDEQQLN